MQSLRIDAEHAKKVVEHVGQVIKASIFVGQVIKASTCGTGYQGIDRQGIDREGYR